MNAIGQIVKRWWWLAVLVCGPAVLAGPPVNTNQVTLAWDASPDAQVKGYYVYVSTQSGSYDYRNNASNSLTFQVGGLIPKTTYYFVVTAYDADGLESDPSNEVDYTVPETGVQNLIGPSYQKAGVAPGDIGGLKMLATGQTQMTFATAVGKTYRVWATSNFRDWDLVQTVTAINVATQIQDLAALGHSTRFYRIELTP